MKRIISLFILITVAALNVKAENILILEELIQCHKTLSNKLRKRAREEEAVTALTLITTNNTNDYKVIVEDNQNRVEGAFASVQFMADIVYLTRMAANTAEMCTKYIGRAIEKSVQHPVLLLYADQALSMTGMHIEGIYKLMVMVATSGTNVVLANNEERTQFCFMIRTKLEAIQNIVNELKTVTYRYELFGGERFSKNDDIEAVFNGSKMAEAKESVLKMLEEAATKQ